MYPIDTSICSKNAWYTPDEAKDYYGRYAREGVTIHWWGNNEQADQHDNIVSYFMQQAQASVKSVNYVVSDNKITKMVEPDDVAWASEGGNPTTVSIEFQPTLGDEGYKRGGWLIAQLEARYGTLELLPHNHWFETDCPGSISLDRLRSEADNSKTKKEETMTAQQVDEMIAATYVAIAGRNPTDPEFVLHRQQYALQGDAWWLQMVEGFKGDDVAWKKYERNLIDAGNKLTQNPDAQTVQEIKTILARR